MGTIRRVSALLPIGNDRQGLPDSEPLPAQHVIQQDSGLGERQRGRLVLTAGGVALPRQLGESGSVTCVILPTVGRAMHAGFIQAILL